MNAIVLRSPRSLAKPRRVEIVKHTPAAATVLQGMATAVVRGFRGATDLAVRAREAAAAPRRQARWVDATEIDRPEPPPALPAEPRQVKVTKFLDMFD